MDRNMSKDVGQILYLSGAIEPHSEGISKEVFTLHNHFKSSYVIGTSPDGRFMYSQAKRYFGIPSRFLPTLRYWVPLVAHNFKLIHIFHGIDCYHYLKIKGSKPVILTSISVDQILSMEHYRKVSTVIVESPRDREKLIANGFDPEKVAVIYPGTDLSVFNDTVPPPEGRFRILFASSPFSLEYMEPRGVRLLLEAAKIKCDVEFIFLWRKRGDTLSLLQQWIGGLAVTNVRVIHEDIVDMNKMFQESHATIVPFTSEKNTKSCPNSAVESLAAGRPVLVSDKVGIADVVQSEQSGVVFQPDAASLVAAITSLQQEYATFQQNARACANRHFDEKVFLESYERLYAEVELSTRRTV
jgi:glycosyltransferase involved in cell wall biosynthesis